MFSPSSILMSSKFPLRLPNFSLWKFLMKLHFGSIGDHAKTTIIMEHVYPVGVPTIEDMKKKEHNQTMLEICSALNYAKFDNIKECTSAFKMW